MAAGCDRADNVAPSGQAILATVLTATEQRPFLRLIPTPTKGAPMRTMTDTRDVELSPVEFDGLRIFERRLDRGATIAEAWVKVARFEAIGEDFLAWLGETNGLNMSILRRQGRWAAVRKLDHDLARRRDRIDLAGLG